MTTTSSANAERPAELGAEVGGAVVVVGLERDDQSAGADDTSRGPQDRGNLGRMVGVVVEDADAVHDALGFEPAPSTGEERQARGELGERTARDRGRRSRRRPRSVALCWPGTRNRTWPSGRPPALSWNVEPVPAKRQAR